jgi:hypothetical protein
MPFAAEPLHHRQNRGAREPARGAKSFDGLGDGRSARVSNVTKEREFLLAY